MICATIMPAEVTALKKYACPACGAEAVWTPSKKALVCPYCSTISPAELKADGSLIEESDLVSALRSIPANKRGWAAVRKTVKCQSCHAISVFDEKRVAQSCDFCGSPSILAVDDVAAPIRPGSVIPFTVAQSQVREDIRRWYASHFWAPNALGDKALTDTLRGMYLPYWTFDSHAECPWEAEAGYHYHERDSQGRTVVRTRWEYATGHVTADFDDMLVPASKGVHPQLLEDLQPFPTTTNLVPYDPGYLSGWVVEQYQIDLLAAAQDSRARMEARLQSQCADEVPGDTHRGLRIAPEFSAQTFKHVLLPVWLLTYTYGTRNFQVAVNGVTGKITGEYPISWVKVMIAILIGLIVLFFFLGMQEGR